MKAKSNDCSFGFLLQIQLADFVVASLSGKLPPRFSFMWDTGIHCKDIKNGRLICNDFWYYWGTCVLGEGVFKSRGEWMKATRKIVAERMTQDSTRERERERERDRTQDIARPVSRRYQKLSPSLVCLFTTPRGSDWPPPLPFR